MWYGKLSRCSISDQFLNKKGANEMDEIATFIGNYIVKLFEFINLDVALESVEWWGAREVGYATIFITLVILVLLYIKNK